ncbi:hypothetical protein ADK53_32260 [Streptomyces sp. WM6373]|uniref:DUF4190 domain-containing protein n=1 Tax=Streptomyces TaxID=1883 RepID=UPI0006AE996E|nr:MULTISPECIES: DUF4190 domain-containing protein [unclassified Streptomyces]KOU29391.1 hypothetical protein ADK53_32260 [Streptomyces sp. WM6373]KOU61017.1 hypothetical protein ADK96_29675 [Streptomyces sp. IGB124]
MNDSSPEPRDPWAPPERPVVDLGKSQGTHGPPGVSGPPSVHDQPTLAGMPGEQTTPAAPGPAASAPAAGPASAAYGYPAAQPGYGYPGDAGHPGPGYPGYPAQQGYPFPGAYPPYGRRPSNGFGVTSLVLGILAVVGCITSFMAVALGIGAVVFGALGKGKANRGEADNGGMALAGIILGGVGIALGLLMLFAMFAPFLDGEWDDSPRRESPYSDSRLHERV